MGDFICNYCQRELPSSKRAEGVADSVCDKCEHRVEWDQITTNRRKNKERNRKVETVEDNSSTEILKEDSVERKIDRGQIYSVGFEINSSSWVEYRIEVLSGPAIDIVVLDEKNWKKWKAKSGAKYISEVSELNTSKTSKQGKVSRGSYYLVVDNTSMGEATPPMLGESEVAFEIEYIIYR